MFKVEDLKDEISKLGFIRCISIANNNETHNFKFDSKKVISKILTNFANKNVLSLEDFQKLINEYNEEIGWSINEAIFRAIDTLIENSNSSSKIWKIENTIWIAILQDKIFNDIREMYYEMIQDRNSK